MKSTLTPGMTVDGSTPHHARPVSGCFRIPARVISNNKVNEARFGYSSIYYVIAQQLAGVEDVDKEIGVPIPLPTPNLWGVPAVGLTNNLTGFGNSTNGPYTIDNKYFELYR
jgi:hypothetical protein